MIYQSEQHADIVPFFQLMAYQIAFDLEESATQDFLLRIIKELPQPETTQEEGSDKPVSIRKIVYHL